MMEKEVYYDQYCKTCKYEKSPDSEDKCNDCLAAPSNEDSHKPVYWEEK